MAKRWSGYLILGMWLLNLLHLYLGFSPWPAAIAAWGASLLTWPWLVGAARRQALALYGAALALLIFSCCGGQASLPVTGCCPTSTCSPCLRR